MVRILPSGEIVPDDDPRARQSTNRNRGGQGFHEQYQQQGQGHDGAAGQMQQGASIFDTFNRKLLALGIPRWNMGSIVVEPIASVGIILAGLLMGVQGLFFAALIFFAFQWSQSQGGFNNIFGGGNGRQTEGREQPGLGGGGSSRGRGGSSRGSGRGHTLGRT